MSTLPHYNQLLCQPFWEKGYDVTYQPSCLQGEYNGFCWEIYYPKDITWTDDKVVIMHTQDFLGIIDHRCPELNDIESYFGVFAERVVVVHWNMGLERVYNGPLNLLYFPTHSYELLNNIGMYYRQWASYFFKERTHKWQCLNGIKRRHRELVANKLHAEFDNGILSLGDTIPLIESNYADYKGCDNELNWNRLLYVYSDCDINIVTETMYTENPGIITEKTLMAFLAQQVPIVIGYPGIVTDIQSLGFDMFTDIVDTSYDAEPDGVRWHSAIELNKELLTNGFDRKELDLRLYANMHHALEMPERLVGHYFERANKVLESLS